MIPKPLARHLDGLRGQFILMLSTPWALVGLSYILFRTPTRSASFAYLPDWLDENELGWVWVIAAAVMVACAFIGKWKPQLTTVGFLTAMVPPLLWALMFVGGFLTGGPITAVVSTIMYAAYAAIIYFVSGWPNPRPGDTSGGS